MSHIAWIKAALARDPTKTRAGLAAALGLDKSQATRILNGTREIKLRELPVIAGYLGAPVPSGAELAAFARGASPWGEGPGFSEDAAAFAGAPHAALAPVYEIRAEVPGDWVVMRNIKPIDLKPRAPHFENAARVFGFYAPDDSMAPRFRPGEIIWVDPARPAAEGEDAAAMQRGRADRPTRIVIGELRSRTARETVLHQYKERKDRRLPAASWTVMRVLPRY